MGVIGKWLVSRRGFVAGSAGTVAAASAVGMTACTSGGKTSTSKLAIIHTNDSHGHDLLNDESLGLAAAAQLRNDYEAQGYEVLLLDAGDFAQGENLVNRSQGDTAVDFMNACGYQAACLGNHEFDYGQQKVSDYVTQAEFPLLAANIVVKATGDTLVEAHTTMSLADGTKIGLFGLTTPETYTKANPLFMRGLTFFEGEALYACAQEQADILRGEGCELVICIAHLGEADESAPNRAVDVVSHTRGIDLVIDGHDHEEENQLIPNVEGVDVLVVETGCYTHAVGVVTWEEEAPSASLESFGSYEGQDEIVAAYIQQVADEVYADLQDLVATTAYLLDGEREPGIRTHETNLGDLVVDAMLWEAEQMADDRPDCAIINSGAIRQSINPGDITVGDVLNVLPFLNYVCTVQVSGAQLLEAIEASCAVTPNPMGSFPQVSGMNFTIDTRTPYTPGAKYPDSTYESPALPGSRVTIHTVGDREFSLTDTYTIASVDFLCAGGDTYFVFAEAASLTMKPVNYLLSDCLVYYLTEVYDGEVPEEYADPAGQGRIEIII